MSFRIAHASIDERGHITGGTPGDQTGKEVCIRTWYRKPWQYMIRCREEPMREKIARAMEQACGNPCIGYNQVQRNTLLTQARRTERINRKTKWTSGTVSLKKNFEAKMGDR